MDKCETPINTQTTRYNEASDITYNEANNILYNGNKWMPVDTPQPKPKPSKWVEVID